MYKYLACMYVCALCLYLVLVGAVSARTGVIDGCETDRVYSELAQR